MRLDEHFDGVELDPSVWFPYYLPHWSSRAASAATHEVAGGELRLSIPADQPLWCAGVHDGPLRVSCIQSGSFSGPVGSAIGGQPFADGQLVTEEQDEFWGYTPLYGHVEMRARAVITPRSMVAFWMSGIEDTPQHSGEICVMEVFGNAVRAGAGFAGSLDAGAGGSADVGAGGSADVGAGGSADVGIGGSADVGIGVKNFRDPALRWDFTADPQEIDISDFHTYGVDWRPGSLSFTVDGKPVRQVDRSPNYPVQLMIGVFDFPDRADPSTSEIPVPELVVSHVIGHPLGA